MSGRSSSTEPHVDLNGQEREIELKIHRIFAVCIYVDETHPHAKHWRRARLSLSP